VSCVSLTDTVHCYTVLCLNVSTQYRALHAAQKPDRRSRERVTLCCTVSPPAHTRRACARGRPQGLTSEAVEEFPNGGRGKGWRRVSEARRAPHNRVSLVAAIILDARVDASYHAGVCAAVRFLPVVTRGLPGGVRDDRVCASVREPRRDLPGTAGTAKKGVGPVAHDWRDGADLIAQLAANRVGHDATIAYARREDSCLVDAVVALELCEHGTHKGDVPSAAVGPAGATAVR